MNKIILILGILIFIIILTYIIGISLIHIFDQKLTENGLQSVIVYLNPNDPNSKKNKFIITRSKKAKEYKENRERSKSIFKHGFDASKIKQKIRKPKFNKEKTIESFSSNIKIDKYLGNYQKKYSKLKQKPQNNLVQLY